jgi:hypothetical protein
MATTTNKLKMGQQITEDVYEAEWQGSEVALIQIKIKERAYKERYAYLAIDRALNIVRMHTHFEHIDSVDLALERGKCSLLELVDDKFCGSTIEKNKNKVDFLAMVKPSSLWPKDEPPTLLLKIIR